MKKLITVTMAALLLGCTTTLLAQDEKKNTEVRKVKKEVKKDAKAVGHKTAEIGSKTKAKVTDNVYKDKVGPDGQTIYIDNHSKYYWVDKKGHNVYITKARLKDK